MRTRLGERDRYVDDSRFHQESQTDAISPSDEVLLLATLTGVDREVGSPYSAWPIAQE